MYIRMLCLLACNFFLITTRAQLSVSLPDLPGGIVQKSQLWNMALMYSSDASVNVTVALSLTDVNTNQVVMTAFARPITITKGVRQLKIQDVAPIDYNYFSPVFSVNNLPDAFIPIGSYRACFTFYTSKSNDQVIAEECMAFEVMPLSPPQLHIPFDSAGIETPYPQFTWLPPTPLTLFTNLRYDLLVAEVQTGQTPETAIQENLPVYTALNLTSMVNNYPASNKGLDTGKLYAWRIIAKNFESFAAQSEVWTFHVKKKGNIPVTALIKNFIELTSDNGLLKTGIISDNTLGVKYYSYDKTHEAVIRFTNEKGEVMKEVTKTILYGNNFLLFQLDRAFNTDTNYFIELNDMQMSRYKACFRISQ